MSRIDPDRPAQSGQTSRGVSQFPGPVLLFDHVTVRLDDQPVLVDVSFAAQAGETKILLGAAGSGKTVLLKTAIGLIQPQEGRVSLFGRDIAGLPEAEQYPLRQRVGVLFQESALFDSLTVEENVAYPLMYQTEREPPESEVRSTVQQALDFVELGRTLDQYPSELSGGMRRRVGIARAGVTRPPLMLYDSPTAGLDPITANLIINLLIRQRDTWNTTSLVATHRYQDGHLMANISYRPESDQLVRRPHVQHRTGFMVLREGRLVFDGSEEELQASTDPYVSKFRKSRQSPPASGEDETIDDEVLHTLYPHERAG